MNNSAKSIFAISNSLALLCIFVCLFYTISVVGQSVLFLPYTLSSDQMLKYTQLYVGKRFSDNRFYVFDQLLKRFRLVTIEEAWVVLRSH